MKFGFVVLLHFGSWRPARWMKRREGANGRIGGNVSAFANRGCGSSGVVGQNPANIDEYKTFVTSQFISAVALPSS